MAGPSQHPIHTNLAPPADEKDYFDVSDYENDIEAARATTPIRKSNESSPTTSVYDLLTTAPDDTVAAAQPYVTYHFYHTKSHLNLQLTRVDAHGNETHFYVDNSTFTPGKPDVTLRTGQSKDGGDVVGVCRFNFMFGNFIIGLGDPGKEFRHNKAEDDSLPKSTDTVRWERMKRHGYFSKRYWEFNDPDPSQPSHSYHWKRTHDKKLGANMSTRNKKLVDVQSGNIVAVFATNSFKSWRKMGKLEVFVDTEQRGMWETMVLVSFLGILENGRRKERSAAGRGGGGGGA
jgi:hypothetical protein